IDGLFMLNVGLILALGGGKILEITQEYITAESSISVANSLTDRIMERLMHAETAWLSGQKRGEILQAVSDDVETVKRISVSTLPQFLYMLLVAVTSTVTIARVYYPVLLVAAIVYPLYLLPLGKNSRMQENAERSLRDVKAKSRGFIIETFENIKDIKIYGAEQASTEVFGGLQEQWSEDIKQKYVAVNMFKSVPRVLAALGPALVYIFAGIAVIHGNLSIGSVVTLAALCRSRANRSGRIPGSISISMS
ncbi:MAG: ABC transporter transmembrane domain-containing protein, partial [Gallintestinimicrobium sp.]